MKHVVIATVLSCGIAASLAVAEGQGEKQKPAAPEAKEVKRERPPLQDLVLTGKVIQQEKTEKDKNGVEVKRMLYLLETEAGNVPLFVEKKKEGAVDWAALVGKTVKVTGQGWCREEKGTKKTMLVKITAVEEVAAPAPAP